MADKALAPTGGGGLRAAVEAQLEAMSPRDRVLLTGLIGFVTVILLGVIVFTVRGAIDDRASRVRTAKDNLEIIQAMGQEYTTAAAKIQRAEERLGQYRGQPATAHLESVARDNGILESFTVTDQGSEVVDGLRQTRMRVDLKKVEIAQAVTYLHDVERSDYPLTVELARFRTQVADGRKVLDVTLEITSFQLVEGG